MNQKYINQQGSLLLELIAGVLIVGLIVLVLNNLPQSLRLVGSSHREVLAGQIASKAIEDLRARTYANLAYTASPAPIADVRISQLPVGSGTYEIKTCPGPSDPQPVCKSTPTELTKYVVVKVRWNDNGKPQLTELDTLISQGGLQ